MHAYTHIWARAGETPPPRRVGSQGWPAPPPFRKKGMVPRYFRDEEIWNQNSGREARISIPNFRRHILRFSGPRQSRTRCSNHREPVFFMSIYPPLVETAKNILRFIGATYLGWSLPREYIQEHTDLGILGASYLGWSLPHREKSCWLRLLIGVLIKSPYKDSL